MFETAKQARLLPSDISKLLKVHRVTVSLWYAGKKKPHHLLLTRVNKLLDAIGRAFEAGDLPVPLDTPRRQRGLYIQEVVVRHLRAAQEASAPSK
jgi:hypothetical protein